MYCAEEVDGYQEAVAYEDGKAMEHASAPPPPPPEGLPARCTKCEKSTTTALQLKLNNMKLEKELESQKAQVEFYKNKDRENQAVLASLRLVSSSSKESQSETRGWSYGQRCRLSQLIAYRVSDPKR